MVVSDLGEVRIFFCREGDGQVWGVSGKDCECAIGVCKCILMGRRCQRRLFEVVLFCARADTSDFCTKDH